MFCANYTKIKDNANIRRGVLSGVGMKAFRYFYLFLILSAGTVIHGAPSARDEAIKQLNLLLKKPTKDVTPADRQAVERLIRGLSRMSADATAVREAEKIKVRWEAKFQEYACTKEEQSLISVLGEENYAKARRGEDIDPMTIRKDFIVGMGQLLKDAQILQDILKKLEATTIADALSKISNYKQAAANKKPNRAVEAVLKEISQISDKNKQLDHEIEAKNQKLHEKEALVRTIRSELEVADAACNKKEETLAEIYGVTLGEENWEQLKIAVDKKIAGEKSSLVEPRMVLTFDKVPQQSSLRKGFENSMVEQKKELAELQNAIRPIEAELGCAHKEIRMRMVLNYYANRQKGIFAGFVDDYLIPIMRNKDLGVQENANLAPYFNESTFSGKSPCEKKIQKLVSALEYYNKSGMKKDSFVETYVFPVVNGSEWSSEIKNNIQQYNREATGLRDPGFGSDRNNNNYNVAQEEYKQIFESGS